jgi:hypothetical protein
MKNNFYLLSFIFFSLCNFAFRKQSGIVVDKADQPVPLQHKILMKAVANEDDGRFILNHKTYGTLVVTSVGF